VPIVEFVGQEPTNSTLDLMWRSPREYGTASCTSASHRGRAVSPDRDECPAPSAGGAPGARRAGRVPTIFAMGGGGFTMEPENPALDEYVRGLAPAREPRICLLPTAGGDSEDQIRRFYTAFADQLCKPTHVSLFRLGAQLVPLREHLLSQDVVYVGGGSMINLLALWRAHGVDAILREAWQAGIVLAGLSAGSMCWFEHGITTSTGAPRAAAGLGFLPGSNSVHHDGEPARRPVFLDAVARGDIPPGWGVDDGVGLLFRGTRVAEAVTSRPGARAYRVHVVEGEVVEEAIEPRVLTLSVRVDPKTPLAVAELRALRAARQGRLD